MKPYWEDWFLVDGEWCHYVIINHEDGSGELYIDGILKGTRHKQIDGLQLNWLKRVPDKHEIGSSNLSGPIKQ